MSNLDLLSNWTDITYSGDQIRFATTALNEIYVDYAKDDEIIMDKASGWFSYKRKDGQYIRPDVDRLTYAGFLRDIMSCSREDFKVNITDWSKVPSFIWYNYKPSYDNKFLELSQEESQIELTNTPQYYCDVTANTGFFIRLNSDIDSMAYLGILDNRFATNGYVVVCKLFIFDKGGNVTNSSIKINCKPNQYKFTNLSKFISNSTDYIIIEPSSIYLQTADDIDFSINDEDKKIIGLINNGSNLVVSSFDVVTQVYMDAQIMSDREYRYRTKLHKILNSIDMCKIESPGQSEDSETKEYIYPCKLNMIVPETKIDTFMRIDRMNCIPKETGTLTDEEESFFCTKLNDEPYAKL